MHPDLQPLLTLQEKDKTVDAVKASLAELLPEEKALDDELDQQSLALSDAQRAVSGAEVRKTELENRIQGYKQLQERRRQQLDFVRGAKEASTLMAEIDMARQVLVKEEADFLRSGDAIVEADKRVKDVTKTHAATVVRQEEARAALAGKRAELEEQLKAAQAERQAATADVKPSMLVRYERIHRGKAPLAVFPLNKDSCGNCFTAVPVQRRILIQQGATIESCEVCGVLLYAAEA
jgi:predicted  nucleic acid-binding Zn-ribbon protein